MNKRRDDEDEKQDGFEYGKIVESNEVPNWARRQPKWQDLIEEIMKLKPGQSLPVTFKSLSAANRARNTVRDSVNLKVGKAVLRTRLIKNYEKTVVYFTRLYDDEVVEEKRE